VDRVALTLVAADRPSEVPATVRAGGTLTLDRADLEQATGWELRDEGLCHGDVCVPVRDRDALVVDGEISLPAFAAALRRPLVAEPAAGVAVLGESADALAEVGESLVAPPFTLPDLDGKPVSLADFMGRKRLLMFWASW
jgi:hypothetical protein